MSQTPPEAKIAVERILTKANPENEAAYAVIFRAVKICIEAGMNRRQTARYLGVSAGSTSTANTSAQRSRSAPCLEKPSDPPRSTSQQKTLRRS